MATHAQQTVWELYEESYADLVDAVRRDHVRAGKFGGGHDFTHALMVARYAVVIAEDLEIGELAWVAAICHNTDRIYHDFDERQIEMMLQTYLGETDLDLGRRQLVVQAVLKHHDLNQHEDSPVLVVLKDADRLANIGPNNILRSGQHYHMLPAYDPRFVVSPDPEATYREPQTVLHDTLCSLEWEPWLRCPKAIALAKPYFAFYRGFKRMFEYQMREVGFVNDEGSPTYPFPEDLELTYKQEAAH